MKEILEVLKNIEASLTYQTKLLESMVESEKPRSSESVVNVMEDLIFKNLKGFVPDGVLNEALRKAKEVNKK